MRVTRRSRITTKTNFVVNEKKGTVTCIMDFNLQLKKLKLWGSACACSWKRQFPDINCWGKGKIVTVAKCSPEDTFSEKAGRRIAEGKAKVKLFKIAKNFYKNLYVKMLRGLDEIRELEGNCEFLAKKEVEHLKEVM